MNKINIIRTIAEAIVITGFILKTHDLKKRLNESVNTGKDLMEYICSDRFKAGVIAQIKKENPDLAEQMRKKAQEAIREAKKKDMQMERDNGNL